MADDSERTPPESDRLEELGTREQATGRFARVLRRGALSALVLSDLRAGRTPSPHTLTEVGLSEVHLYTAVAADIDPSGELEHELARSGASGGFPVVQAVIDRWLFALVPGTVDVGVGGGTLARSSRQPLARATAAFTEAERALSTAHVLGVTGVVDLAQLMTLPLVSGRGSASDQRRSGSDPQGSR